MVALEPVPGVNLRPQDVAAHAEARMPAFMVPRYCRVLPGLPRSATDKIVKTGLAADGITSDSLDRQAARAGNAVRGPR